MVDARLIAALVLVLMGCGGTVTPRPPQHDTNASVLEFPDTAHMLTFHSTRFSVTLPLPDGHAWRIDDHHAPVLKAMHAPTQSQVELVVWHEEQLVNRAMCETRAREKGYAADLDAETVEQAVENFPAGWDTRVWLGVEATHVQHEARATAHLVAFGAFIRKCLYFHFATTGRKEEGEAISSRLAYARLRIFGGLKLDSLDVVPRAREVEGHDAPSPQTR